MAKDGPRIMTDIPHPDEQAKQFWEKHYKNRKKPWSGKANAVLERFTADLPVGTALDIGCGTGANALWLATHGWHIVAVDISDTALEQAKSNAASAQLEHITFQQHDLTRSFPSGTFDLVYAMYLQSPLTFPRERILQKAAKAVAPGGLLLIVTHASVAPWSWNQSERFPIPQEALAELELDLRMWRTVFLGAPERLANGPDGQSATVADTVIALECLAS